jgi:hypothetical protein
MVIVMNIQQYKIKVLVGLRHSKSPDKRRFMVVRLTPETGKYDPMTSTVVTLFEGSKHQPLLLDLIDITKNWKVFPQTVRLKRVTGEVLCIPSNPYLIMNTKGKPIVSMQFDKQSGLYLKHAATANEVKMFILDGENSSKVIKKKLKNRIYI